MANDKPGERAAVPEAEMRTLRPPEQRRSATPARPNPLEALLATLTADHPPTRTLKAVTDPSTGWTTATVELRMPRPVPWRAAGQVRLTHETEDQHGVN